MHIYKNNSQLELVIPGVGKVAAGETLKSAEILENPNLEEVKGEVVTPVVEPAPAPVAPAPSVNEGIIE